MFPPWLPSRDEEWVRCPGASPLMRMTASWFRSSRIDRIQGCARSSRLIASSLGIVVVCSHYASPDQRQLAIVLVTVKGKSLSDGLRPPLTVTARGGQRKPGRAEETRRLKISLDNNRLIQGGPFEVDNQVLISSHRKLLSSKAMVVNVAEKSKGDFDRYD